MLQGSDTRTHARARMATCVSLRFGQQGEKEGGGDKTVTLQRGYAWFHLPRRLSVPAQPTHLYVFAVISSSHLEKVDLHLLILIALYLPVTPPIPPSPPSLLLLCLVS